MDCLGRWVYLHGTGLFFRCVDLGITYTIPITDSCDDCIFTYTFTIRNQQYIIHVGRYTPDMDGLGHFGHNSHMIPENYSESP